MELGPLIRDYGYLAVFVGNLFEGETVVLLAGAAVHFGFLDMAGVLASALAGSVAGDQLWFFLGRRWGPRILSRHPSWQERAERVHRYMRRHQDLLMFSFRFYYGLRTVTPFAIGSAQVSPLRFCTLNFASAVLWTCVFVFAGYFLGGATERLVADKAYVPYALGGAALVVFIALVAMRMRRRSRAAP